MKTLIALIFLFTITSTAQIFEKPLELQDSLFSVSLFKNIKLTNHLTLKPGLTVRRRTIFNTFETPVLLDYYINERWSAFMGVHSRFVLNSNFQNIGIHFEQPSNVFYSIGSDYKFNEKTSGYMSLSFPAEFNLGFKF